MKKKKVVILVCIILVIFCCFLFVEIEGYEANKCIKEFISRGEYVTTINKTEYYKVVKRYKYEDTSNIIDDIEDKYIGTTGDIYISSKDPLDFFLTNYLSKRLRIGHGALVQSEDALTMVEVTGNDSKENNVVKEVPNEWFERKNEEITILRAKNISEENKKDIQNSLNDKCGMPYNYLFLIHAKNRYYCLDLCSRVYEEINNDIDGRTLITFGSSMIKNDNTYIIYYKKKVKSNDINYRVYYLSEE